MRAMGSCFVLLLGVVMWVVRDGVAWKCLLSKERMKEGGCFAVDGSKHGQTQLVDCVLHVFVSVKRRRGRDGGGREGEREREREAEGEIVREGTKMITILCMST